MTPTEQEVNNTALKLTAFRIPDREAYPRLIRAPADREWMDVTTNGWANRCLPLRIANQAGWFILNDEEFEVTWDGSLKLDAVRFKWGARRSRFACSMFGFGMVTWTIPYLFRTEPGFNMIARGPVNMPKDGISPLDGIVETDWLPYPFTMNWKITRPDHKVRFEKDEPICMIHPVRRYTVEQFSPELRNLTSDPSLYESYQSWRDARAEKIRSSPQSVKASETAPKIQGNYIRGVSVLNEKAPEHQNKLDVRDFVLVEPEVLKPSTGMATEPEIQKGWWSRFTSWFR